MIGDNRWLGVREFMGRNGKDSVNFGDRISYWCHKTPRRLLHHTAYYKFAAKMIGGGKSVLDLGCAEGLGTWLLAKECGTSFGVDIDRQAIETAQRNWQGNNILFTCGDFFETHYDTLFNAAVSFDVIEYIPGERAEGFLTIIREAMTPYGVAVIGTPSLEGQRFTSKISKRGYVNVYDGERLEKEMRRHFQHVFIFSANDEVIHTGYLRMAHYLIAVGCGAKK